VGEGEMSIPMIRNAITFSETPATYRSAPPALGAHSHDIKNWLTQPEETS
jgi:crotonobetainyl-CoA:carnitine CoA-transferase CaiB-like acyl-CoA transferase